MEGMGLIVVRNMVLQINTIGIGYAIGFDVGTGEAVCGFIRIGDQAHFGFDINRKCGCANVIALPSLYRIGVLMVVTGNIFPYTDGQACQNCRTLFGYIAGACKGQGCNIFGLVVGSCKLPIHFKAAENFCIVQFPVVHAVEVENDFNLLYVFNFVSNDVDPVDGVVEHVLLLGVMRTDINCLCHVAALDIDLTASFGIVARLVTDAHTDGMNTVGKLDIINADHTVCKLAVNFDTVDISNSSRSIQTGSIVLCHIIFDLGGKGCDRGLNGLTLQSSSIGHTGNCIGHAGEYGQFSVGNRIRIVDGDIVDVECKVACKVGQIFLPCIDIDRIETDKLVGLVLKCRTIEGLANVLCVVFDVVGTARQRHMDITPAGIAQIVICIFGRFIQNTTVHLAVCTMGEDLNKHTQLNSIFGYIQPEAQTRGILQLDGIAQPLQTVAGPELGTVDSFVHLIVEGQRLAAVANHTGLGCDNGQCAMDVLTIDLVSQPPIAQIGFGSITFEVHEDFRALAQLQRNGMTNRAVGCQLNGDGCFANNLACCKLVAADGTDGVIRQRELNIIILQNNSIDTVFCNELQFNGLAQRYQQAAALEGQRIGLNNMNDCRADNLAINNHRDLCITFCTIGGESAFLGDRTQGCGVFIICRDICSCTGRADAYGFYIDNRTGSDIAVFSCQCCSFKDIGGRCCGVNNDTVGNSTLGTVRRNAGDFDLIRTCGTGNIGCRTAAVQAQDLCASGLLEDLNGFCIIGTCGTASTVTINSHQNDLVVCSNTNKGTGITAVVQIVGAGCCGIKGDLCAVLHDQLETADGFLCCAVGFNSSIPLSPCGTAKSCAVCKNCKPGVFIRIGLGSECTVIALHDMYAGGRTRTGIVTVTVDAGYNRIVGDIVVCIRRIGMQCFQRCCLVGHLCHTSNITLCILIGGVNAYILIAKICNGIIVVNKSSIRCIHRVLVLSNSRSQCRFLTRSQNHSSESVTSFLGCIGCERHCYKST